MEGEPFVEDVDDVLFGTRSLGALGCERVDVAVDGHQLVVNGDSLVFGFFEMGIHDVDGVLDLHDIIVHGILLQDERLLDADEVKGVLADGVDLGRHKTVALLSHQ